ncbi:MAG: AAA family ATPase [Candidatus Micrarchaeia archaeon]
MNKTIICLTGRPGSGKTESSRILKKFGFVLIEMGSIIREEMAKSNVQLTNKNTKEFMLKFREKYGKDIVAKKTLEKIKSTKADNKNSDIAIIGIRSIDEQEFFKNNLKKIYTIALVSSQEERFRRLSNRNRYDDSKDMNEFLKYREENETKVGIDKAIENADYIIDNSSTIEELEKNLFMVLKNIRKDSQ